MIVFRVEHEDKHGPYMYTVGNEKRSENIRNLANVMCMKHSSSKDITHPAAHYIPGYASGNYVCGFRTLADLKRWFNGFQNKLRKVGYKISLYEVDEIMTDSYQCIFNLASAKFLCRIPMRANTRKYHEIYRD